jgi:hypothetical protein
VKKKMSTKASHKRKKKFEQKRKPYPRRKNEEIREQQKFGGLKTSS